MSSPAQHPYPAAQPLSPADERQWAMLIHLGGLVFHFLPALIGYLVLKDRGAYIRQQTTTALNFQLTILIAYVIGVFTIWFFIGFLIIIAAGLVDIVFCILAAIAANRGEAYTYPVALRLIKN